MAGACYSTRPALLCVRYVFQAQQLANLTGQPPAELTNVVQLHTARSVIHHGLHRRNWYASLLHDRPQAKLTPLAVFFGCNKQPHLTTHDFHASDYTTDAELNVL